jgi:hypothetical protein
MLLADAWQGRDPGGLWLMLPQGVAVVVCCAAGTLLALCLPIALTIVLGVLLAFSLLTAPFIIALYADRLGNPSAAAIAYGLAAVLAPLAWWRLAEVELP